MKGCIALGMFAALIGTAAVQAAPAQGITRQTTEHFKGGLQGDDPADLQRRVLENMTKECRLIGGELINFTFETLTGSNGYEVLAEADCRPLR